MVFVWPSVTVDCYDFFEASVKLIGDQFACVSFLNAKFWDIAEEGLTQSFSINFPDLAIFPTVDVFDNFKIFSSYSRNYDPTIQVYDDNGNLVHSETFLDVEVMG